MIAASTTSDLPPSQDSDDNPRGFKHVPALDGIRGLAILLVLFDHLFWSNSEAAHGVLAIFADLRDSSYAGVNLFFALSGFLISGILMDTLNIPNYFRTFYVRRALRIFPLYYGVLFILLILTRPMHLLWSGWQYYALTYTGNLAMWRHNAPMNLGVLGINHFWSLQVEEQFYFVWPLVVFHLRRPRRIALVSLVLSACILLLRSFFVVMAGRPGFTNPYLVYAPTFVCADNILFGCFLAAITRTHWREASIRWSPRVLAVCAVPLFLYGFRHHGLVWMNQAGHDRLFFMPTVGFTLLGICAASLIAMTLNPTSVTRRIFQIPIMRFFGRYSYGIYVFHYAIDQVLTARIRYYLDLHFHSKAFGVFGGAFIVGCATIVVALASYHFYEKRFLHLKKFFGYGRAAAVTRTA